MHRKGGGGVVYMERRPGWRGETALQQLGHKETQRPFFSCPPASFSSSSLFYLGSSKRKRKGLMKGVRVCQKIDGVKKLGGKEGLLVGHICKLVAHERKCVLPGHYEWGNV